MISETQAIIVYSWQELIKKGAEGFRVVSKTAWDKKRAELQSQRSDGEGANLDRATPSASEQ